MVCEEGNYKGGYTGFPQFGVAFDVRKGDFLAMDVHEWHCNTPIICDNTDCCNCYKNKKTTYNNKKCLNDEKYCRLSVVCYLRKNMVKCKK